MNCNKKRGVVLFLIAILSVSVTGCSYSENTQGYEDASSSTVTSDISTVSTASDNAVDDEMFTARDKEIGYDETTAAIITLADGKSTSNSELAQVSGNTVTIKEEGTYIFSGNLSEGQIVVEAEKTDKLQIVLNGASISNSSSAPVYVKQADKVFVTLATDSENKLSTTGEFVSTDDNNVDAVIFSKEDLTINGNGKLEINSAKGHGIVSKDDLVITSGEYKITASGHAVSGKDSVRIAQGNFTLECGKDGIHAENSDDTSLGFIYVADGDFSINASGDGIDASNTIQIEKGTFSIKTISQSTTITDDSSIKGIKSTSDMTINGGEFTLDCADDALHSNASLSIIDGTFNILSVDDGIHSDEDTIISGGNISITECYEVIEGNTVEISGGNINIVSSDDGINAAGGNDQSGFGGGMRRDNFSAASSDSCIKISGGKIEIVADGDGVDSNSAIYVSGGETYVTGPHSSGNSAFDCDGTSQITGGIFVAAGPNGMAQNFGENSTQGSMLVNASSDEEIALKDSNGNVLVSYTPKRSYTSVLISTPDIKQGETYTLCIGEESMEIEMTSLIYGSDSGMGGGFGGGMRGSGMDDRHMYW